MMNPTPDEEIDLLLKTHLAEELNPHVGQSVVAFRQSLAPRRRIGWWIASASAIAAGIVLGILLTHQPHRDAVIPIVKQDSTKEEPATVVQSAKWTRLEDQGLTLVANEPARQLRRQVVDEVEWYDPRRKATVKTTVPRQQVILIGLKTD